MSSRSVLSLGAALAVIVLLVALSLEAAPSKNDQNNDFQLDPAIQIRPNHRHRNHKNQEQQQWPAMMSFGPVNGFLPMAVPLFGANMSPQGLSLSPYQGKPPGRKHHKKKNKGHVRYTGGKNLTTSKKSKGHCVDCGQLAQLMSKVKDAQTKLDEVYTALNQALAEPNCLDDQSAASPSIIEPQLPADQSTLPQATGDIAGQAPGNLIAGEEHPSELTSAADTASSGSPAPLNADSINQQTAAQTPLPSSPETVPAAAPFGEPVIPLQTTDPIVGSIPAQIPNSEPQVVVPQDQTLSPQGAIQEVGPASPSDELDMQVAASQPDSSAEPASMTPPQQVHGDNDTFQGDASSSPSVQHHQPDALSGPSNGPQDSILANKPALLLPSTPPNTVAGLPENPVAAATDPAPTNSPLSGIVPSNSHILGDLDSHGPFPEDSSLTAQTTDGFPLDPQAPDWNSSPVAAGDIPSGLGQFLTGPKHSTIHQSPPSTQSSHGQMDEPALTGTSDSPIQSQLTPVANQLDRTNNVPAESLIPPNDVLDQVAQPAQQPELSRLNPQTDQGQPQQASVLPQAEGGNGHDSDLDANSSKLPTESIQSTVTEPSVGPPKPTPEGDDNNDHDGPSQVVQANGQLDNSPQPSAMPVDSPKSPSSGDENDDDDDNDDFEDRIVKLPSSATSNNLQNDEDDDDNLIVKSPSAPTPPMNNLPAAQSVEDSNLVKPQPALEQLSGMPIGALATPQEQQQVAPMLNQPPTSVPEITRPADGREKVSQSNNDQVNSAPIGQVEAANEVLPSLVEQGNELPLVGKINEKEHDDGEEEDDDEDDEHHHRLSNDQSQPSETANNMPINLAVAAPDEMAAQAVNSPAIRNGKGKRNDRFDSFLDDSVDLNSRRRKNPHRAGRKVQARRRGSMQPAAKVNAELNSNHFQDAISRGKDPSSNTSSGASSSANSVSQQGQPEVAASQTMAQANTMGKQAKSANSFQVASAVASPTIPQQQHQQQQQQLNFAAQQPTYASAFASGAAGPGNALASSAAAAGNNWAHPVTLNNFNRNNNHNHRRSGVHLHHNRGRHNHHFRESVGRGLSSLRDHVGDMMHENRFVNGFIQKAKHHGKPITSSAYHQAGDVFTSIYEGVHKRHEQHQFNKLLAPAPPFGSGQAAPTSSMAGASWPGASSNSLSAVVPDMLGQIPNVPPAVKQTMALQMPPMPSMANFAGSTTTNTMTSHSPNGVSFVETHNGPTFRRTRSFSSSMSSSSSSSGSYSGASSVAG